MISSTLTRARETAESIIVATSKPLELSPLFVERRRPSAVVGQDQDSEHIQSIYKTVRERFHLPGYRHSDEENFDDVKSRARDAFRFLEARPEDNMLVVTHGIFLRVLAAYLTFGEKLTAEECLRFMKLFETENACITVFSYNKEDTERPWRLITWNDHAHLG